MEINIDKYISRASAAECQEYLHQLTHIQYCLKKQKVYSPRRNQFFKQKKLNLNSKWNILKV